MEKAKICLVLLFLLSASQHAHALSCVEILNASAVNSVDASLFASRRRQRALLEERAADGDLDAQAELAQILASEARLALTESRRDSLYSEIKVVIPTSTKSKELTREQRGKIRSWIKRLEQKGVQFDRAYNLLLAPYGEGFLPKVRDSLKQASIEFREYNQQIINELNRYLLNQSDLMMIDLNIWAPTRRAEESVGNTFIESPGDVRFGLNHFMNSILYSRSGQFIIKEHETSYEGYVFAGRPIEIEDADGWGVRVVKNEEEPDYYPFSDISIDSGNIRGGEPVAGLPLNVRVLNFFKMYGDAKGHLQVIRQRWQIGEPTTLNQIGISRTPKYVNLPLVSTRWDSSSGTYIPLRNMNGDLVHSLGDGSLYSIDSKGHMVVPSVPVTSITSPAGFMGHASQITAFEISGDSFAEAVVAPTPNEFLIALIEFIYTHAE